MTTSAPRHILLVSGGKDSTALAIYMRDRHPEIEMEYVFADTHKELPETYEFLIRLEAYLDQPIVRLSNDLGDRGFDHWLRLYGGYLPAPNMRWCTRKLKIEPFEHFIGEDEALLYVAIRADEHREGYISTKPNIKALFPFKEDGIGKDDVMQILEQSGVGLPEYYSWRSRSGCYFCFFQRKNEWVGLLEKHPDLFYKAKTYEKVDHKTSQKFTWVQNMTLGDVERDREKIKEQAVKLKNQQANKVTLFELFDEFSSDRPGTDDDPGDACLICHL